jgi:hypothetical protein
MYRVPDMLLPTLHAPGQSHAQLAKHHFWHMTGITPMANLGTHSAVAHTSPVWPIVPKCAPLLKVSG